MSDKATLSAWIRGQQFDVCIISFDRDMYRWRHLIENTFAKLKEFRAVATRYDKTDTSYTATIHLAAAIIASR